MVSLRRHFVPNPVQVNYCNRRRRKRRRPLSIHTWYDTAGHVVTETLYDTAADANAGQNAEDTLHYAYDTSGNLTSESDDCSSDTYTYDSQNRLTSATETSVDSPTVVLTYQYSAAGTQPTGVSATIDGVADYQDAYSYNSQGQLTTITRTAAPSGGDAVADETVDLTYNAAGQVQAIDRYQGSQLAVEADYTYDSSGRLVDLVYSQGTTVLESFAYSYAASATSSPLPSGDGQGASSPLTLGEGQGVRASWLPGGAMLPATSTQSIDTAALDKAISPEDLVAGVTSLDGSVAYSYDAEGQLVAANYSPLPPGEGQGEGGQGEGTSGEGGSGQGQAQPNESYSYDANGSRTSSNSSAAVVIGADNEPLFDGTYTYSYDADGNETDKFIDVNHTGVLAAGDTNVTQYTWNADSQLMEVTTSATYGGPVTQTVDYLYDAEGRWIGENILSPLPPGEGQGEGGSGVITHETRFVYDGNQIVLQFDEDGGGAMTGTDLSHRYLWGPAVDQLLSDEQIAPLSSGQGYNVSTPGTVVWPLTDNVGTVRDLAICDLTSGTTLVVNHLDYSSFGQLLSQTNPATGNTAAVDCLFGFTGRPLDKASGLQNNTNRWYNPSLGRWMSDDPTGFTAGDTNEYRYVGNSPANATDPRGLIEIKIGGYVFYVHRNDADPFPSQPHGHIGSPNSPVKVNVETGEIFRGTVATGENIGKKALTTLRARLRAEGLLALAVVIVLETPDMVQAAQEGGAFGVASHTADVAMETAVTTGESAIVGTGAVIALDAAGTPLVVGATTVTTGSVATAAGLGTATVAGGAVIVVGGASLYGGYKLGEQTTGPIAGWAAGKFWDWWYGN